MPLQYCSSTSQGPTNPCSVASHRKYADCEGAGQGYVSCQHTTASCSKVESSRMLDCLCHTMTQFLRSFWGSPEGFHSSSILQLYQACIVPARHFACHAWGPQDSVLPYEGQARGALAAVHLQQLKELVGHRPSVPTPILLAELPRSSMPDVWLLRAAQIWTQLATSPGLHQRVLCRGLWRACALAMWQAWWLY